MLRPDLMLLDEITSALDPELVEVPREEPTQRFLQRVIEAGRLQV